MDRLRPYHSFYTSMVTLLVLVISWSYSQTLREQVFSLNSNCTLVASAQPPALSISSDVMIECAALCLEQGCTVAAFNELSGICTLHTDLVNISGTVTPGEGYLAPIPSAVGASSCACGSLPVASMCLHFLSDREVPWDTATSACATDSLLVSSLQQLDMASFITLYARAMAGPLSLTTTIGQEVDSGLDLTSVTCGVFSIDGCSGQVTVTLSDGLHTSSTEFYLINLFSDTRSPSIHRYRASNPIPDAISVPSTSPTYQQLVCGQSVVYWMRWAGGKVVLGMGQSISLSFFIEFEDNTPPTALDHIALRASGTGTQADWSISTCLDCETVTLSKSADGTVTSTRQFGDCTQDAGYICQSPP